MTEGSSMLVALLLFVSSAFPDRGIVWQAPNAPLVLDRDSLKIQSMSLLGVCNSSYYSLMTGPYGAVVSVNAFPGTTPSNGLHFVSSDWGSGSSPTQDNCGPKGFFYSPVALKSVVEAGSTWAVWLDSAKASLKPRGSSPWDTLLVNPSLRWRWSRVVGTPKWVRWVDTVRLDGSGAFDGAPPLLSMLNEARIDSVVPASSRPPLATFGQKLVIRLDTSEASGTLEWSVARGTSAIVNRNPWNDLPVGSTLYATKASTDSVGTHLWRVWSGGKALDSFWIAGPSDTRIRSRSSATIRHGRDWSIDGRSNQGSTGSGVRFEIGNPPRLVP